MVVSECVWCDVCMQQCKYKQVTLSSNTSRTAASKSEVCVCASCHFSSSVNRGFLPPLLVNRGGCPSLTLFKYLKVMCRETPSCFLNSTLYSRLCAWRRTVISSLLRSVLHCNITIYGVVRKPCIVRTGHKTTLEHAPFCWIVLFLMIASSPIVCF